MFKSAKNFLTINNGVLAVAVLISLSWVWGTVQALQNNFNLQLQVDRLGQEISLLELQNDTLRFQQHYFATDEYIELSARERLNKAKPGERVLILPDNTVFPPAEDQPQTEVEVPITERSNFEQWTYFLFSNKQQ